MAIDCEEDLSFPRFILLKSRRNTRSLSAQDILPKSAWDPPPVDPDLENVPEGAEEYSRAELYIQLPADWKYREYEDPNWGWPQEWLRSTAQHPSQHNSWLGGPVTLVADGIRTSAGGPRQAAVLSVLAMNVGRPVSVECALTGAQPTGLHVGFQTVCAHLTQEYFNICIHRGGANKQIRAAATYKDRVLQQNIAHEYCCATGRSWGPLVKWLGSAECALSYGVIDLFPHQRP